MTSVIVKLVLFVAVCSVMTGYLAFTIGNIRLFQHTYGLTATFDDATGLLEADNVKVAGVVVGKVTGVSIDQGRARVGFSVRTSVKLPSDSTAAIRWRNLIGQRYLYLYPGTGSTVLRDGDRVTRTRSVVDVGELFNRLGPIVKAIDPKDVNTFLDAVVAGLDGNKEKLSQTIDDLAVVAASLGQRDAAIGRLIENVNTVVGALDERDAQIRTVLDNLVLISQTFSSNTRVLDEAVTELGDFNGHVGALLSENQAHIDSIVGNLKAVVDEVRVKLPVLDSTLGGLDEALKRMDSSSRYGEWLNNVVPCGAIGDPAVLVSNDPCITGQGSFSNAQPSRGPAALAQLLAGEATHARNGS
jgi:phospholipid/cholesterol/gamma-HCH transport system substrate-binding protein